MIFACCAAVVWLFSRVLSAVSRSVLAGSTFRDVDPDPAGRTHPLTTGAAITSKGQQGKSEGGTKGGTKGGSAFRDVDPDPARRTHLFRTDRAPTGVIPHTYGCAIATRMRQARG